MTLVIQTWIALAIPRSAHRWRTGRESGGLLVGEQVGTGVQGSPDTVERVVRTAAAAGRGGLSPLTVAEKKGTMILLALGRARWASEIWGVISLRPYGSPGTRQHEDAGCL
jgi:hypothetical protein